ncbi:MAG TPA: isopentenyl-diphosphate Delta-isomerase [Puia sp.]|uniref:isopentenyl-diphosphate Delta-isomerase n=1 Tax=Puia sp. TaxID=2045100 RepID=UPI002B66591C|nr:isopentenyl-diphosphate Delta-isomerase [Puia sp.]HVU98705.1 isopentenyl-diphosphate Delta-isomerase [Puia sp.]
MERNHVVLVDPDDNPVGTMDKMEAHEKGVLHRAFSVFIFDKEGRMLLQRRAFSKYHGGGLWTNACCSHPQWGEDIRSGAMERLQYEMGLRCDLTPVFHFVYKTPVENNLIEHELDHVLMGIADGEPHPNPQEVAGTRWAWPAELQQEIEIDPGRFTYWFRMSINKVLLSPWMPGASSPAGTS